MDKTDILTIKIHHPVFLMAIILSLLLHLIIFLMFSKLHWVEVLFPAQTANLQRLTGENTPPIHFIYVGDNKPSPAPPKVAMNFSDLNRIGASPLEGRGTKTSNDPTSYGNSRERRFSQGENAKRRVAERMIQYGGQENPVNSKEDLTNVGTGGLSLPKPKPAGQGLGVKKGIKEAISEMHAGSMSSSFNNPNASKLAKGELSFDTTAYNFGPYAKKVHDLVEWQWHSIMPQAIYLGEMGWCAVRFTIQKNGTVTDISLQRRCSVPSYNQAAVNSIISASLPPLPSDFNEDHVSGVFRFYYNLDSDDNE